MRSILGATAIALCLASTGVFAQKQVVLRATITDLTGAEVTTVNVGDVSFTENGVEGKIIRVEPAAK